MSILYPVIGFQDVKVVDVLPSSDGKACVMYAAPSSSSALRRELLEKSKLQSSLEAPSASRNGQQQQSVVSTSSSSARNNTSTNRNVNPHNSNLCAKSESIFLRPMIKMGTTVTADNVQQDRLQPEVKIAFTESAMGEAYTNGSVLVANINQDKDELFVFRERLISNHDLKAIQQQQNSGGIFSGNPNNNNNNNGNKHSDPNNKYSVATGRKATAQSIVSTSSTLQTNHTGTKTNNHNQNHNNNSYETTNLNALLAANYSRVCTATIFRKVPTVIFEGSTGQAQSLNSRLPYGPASSSANSSSSPSSRSAGNNNNNRSKSPSSNQNNNNNNNSTTKSVTASAAPAVQHSFVPCATMQVDDVTCSVTLKFIRNSNWALRITKKCASAQKRNKNLEEGKVAKSVLAIIDAVKIPQLPQKPTSSGVLDWAKKKMSFFSKNDNNNSNQNNGSSPNSSSSSSKKGTPSSSSSPPSALDNNPNAIHDQQMQFALNYDDTQKVPSLAALNSPSRTCFWADVSDANESIAISLYQISGDQTDSSKRLVGLAVEQLQLPSKQDSTGYDLTRLMSTTIRYNDLNLDYYQPVRAYPVFDPRTPDEADASHAGLKPCPSFLGVALCMRIRPRFSPSSASGTTTREASSEYGGGGLRSRTQSTLDATMTQQQHHQKFGFSTTMSETGYDDATNTEIGSNTNKNNKSRNNRHRRGQSNNLDDDEDEDCTNNNNMNNNNKNNDQNMSVGDLTETATNITADNFTTATLNHSSTFYARRNANNPRYCYNNNINSHHNNNNNNNNRYGGSSTANGGQGDVRVLFFHCNAKERLIQVRGIQLECHSLREAPPTFVYFREARTIGVVSLSENLIHIVDIANVPRGPEYVLASPLMNRQTDTVATRWTRPNTQFRFTEVRGDGTTDTKNKIRYIASSHNGYSVLHLSTNGLRRLSYPLLADAIAQRCSHAWVERQASYAFFLSARIPMKMSLSEVAAREDLINDVTGALRPILRHAFLCLRDPVRFFIHLIDAESRIAANHFISKQKRSHPTFDGLRRLQHLPRDSQGYNTCCGVSFAADTPIHSQIHNAQNEIVHKLIIEFLNTMGKTSSGVGHHWTDVVFPKLDQPQQWIQRFLKLVFATNKTASTSAHVQHQRQLSQQHHLRQASSVSQPQQQQRKDFSETTTSPDENNYASSSSGTASPVKSNPQQQNLSSTGTFASAVPANAVPIPSRKNNNSNSSPDEGSSIRTLTPSSLSHRATPSKLGLTLGGIRNNNNNEEASLATTSDSSPSPKKQPTFTFNNTTTTTGGSNNHSRITSGVEGGGSDQQQQQAEEELDRSIDPSPSQVFSNFQQQLMTNSSQSPAGSTSFASYYNNINYQNNNTGSSSSMPSTPAAAISPGISLIGFDIPPEVIRFSIALNFCSAHEWVQSEAHIRRVMVLMANGTGGGNHNNNNMSSGSGSTTNNVASSISSLANSSISSGGQLTNLMKASSPPSTPSTTTGGGGGGFFSFGGNKSNNANSTTAAGAVNNNSNANTSNLIGMRGLNNIPLDQASSFGTRDASPGSISFFSTTTSSHSAAKFFGVTAPGGNNPTAINSTNSLTNFINSASSVSANTNSSSANFTTGGGGSMNTSSNLTPQQFTQLQNYQKMGEIHEAFDMSTGVKVGLAAPTLPDPALLRFSRLVDWTENPLELSRVLSGRDSLFRKRTTSEMFEPPLSSCEQQQKQVSQLERRCVGSIEYLQKLL